jgi:hypothetical protein
MRATKRSRSAVVMRATTGPEPQVDRPARAHDARLAADPRQLEPPHLARVDNHDPPVCSSFVARSGSVGRGARRGERIVIRWLGRSVQQVFVGERRFDGPLVEPDRGCLVVRAGAAHRSWFPDSASVQCSRTSRTHAAERASPPTTDFEVRTPKFSNVGGDGGSMSSTAARAASV